jgi:phosphatidate cytidylyltransferase
MRNLLRRSTSGLIYVILFVGAILLSQESFIALTSIFAFFCIFEFSKMITLKNIVSYIFFILVVYLMLKRPEEYGVVLILFINILSSLYLIYQLIAKKEITHRNDRSKLGLTIRYIVFSLAFLILIPFALGEYNPSILISILVLIWVNDSFAFLVGKNLGKRKLFESVSPKKTIEGFIGGLIFSILAGYVIAIQTELFSVFNWIIIALITSVIGTIGDLVESKFKRQANVKDSGNIMPGHGGLLDRLDSILFASPFVYLYIHYII